MASTGTRSSSTAATSWQNGFNVTADGVAIENLTVHSYTQNGVLFNGATGSLADGDVYGAGDAVLTGYRASYVTAYNNGLYGIYAFSARDGLIEHVYVSGHPDSGIYVGQCKPCNVVIDAVVAERNAIGYYGTNGSGGIYVVNSLFAHNRLGLAPNSQKVERLSPQAETVVVGNVVIDNDDRETPAIQGGFFGGGIAVGGGTRNTIVRNRGRGQRSGRHHARFARSVPTGGQRRRGQCARGQRDRPRLCARR